MFGKMENVSDLYFAFFTQESANKDFQHRDRSTTWAIVVHKTYQEKHAMWVILSQTLCSNTAQLQCLTSKYSVRCSFEGSLLHAHSYSKLWIQWNDLQKQDLWYESWVLPQFLEKFKGIVQFKAFNYLTREIHRRFMYLLVAERRTQWLPIDYVTLSFNLSIHIPGKPGKTFAKT